MIRARIVLEIEAEGPDPHRPEETQLRDLTAWVMSRLGFGIQQQHGQALMSAVVVEATVLSSTRSRTPIEGAVTAATEDVTAKVLADVEEFLKRG